MIDGARKLPAHHITIRVPWHDQGWNGRVCAKPVDNTHCLILPRVAATKRDAAEVGCAGQRFDELDESVRPACLGERVTFMSQFSATRTIQHPYAEWSPLHEHFADTPFTYESFTAACVPFRWMLRANVEGDAEQKIRGIRNELQLGYEPEREPDLRDRKGRCPRPPSCEDARARRQPFRRYRMRHLVLIQEGRDLLRDAHDGARDHGHALQVMAIRDPFFDAVVLHLDRLRRREFGGDPASGFWTSAPNVTVPRSGPCTSQRLSRARRDLRR